MPTQLAIDGGPPVRTKPFPNHMDATGRNLGQEEKELLMRVIDSGCLFRFGGSMVLRFEEEFAALHGKKHAIATSSGTAALHVAVGALDLEPGDEIITSTVSDPGSIIGILLCNAIPIFTDSEPATGNMDLASVEASVTERTRAIMPVHMAGRPTRMDEIKAIARKHRLVVIEDCAQAHMAEYKGQLVGTIGDMGAFSFQQSKHLTTGDGGIVLTDDDSLAERMRLFADKGWPRDEWPRDHLFLAPNYRMTDLQGAIGVTQTRKLADNVARRRASAGELLHALEGVPGIVLASPHSWEDPSWWKLPIWVDPEVLDVTPDQFQASLAAEGIICQVGFMERTLLDYTFMKERRTYGRSGCPWSCEHARPGIVYREEDYPGARAAVTQPILIHWNECIGPEDVVDVAKAIEKLHSAFRREMQPSG